MSVQHTRIAARSATPRQPQTEGGCAPHGFDGFGHDLTPTTPENAHALSGSFFAGGRL